MAMIMLILSILSALPKLIEFIQYVWGLIKQVRDPVAKAALRQEVHAAVRSSVRAPQGLAPAGAGQYAGHKLDHDACMKAMMSVSNKVWMQLASEAKLASDAAHAELTAALAAAAAPAPAATA